MFIEKYYKRKGGQPYYAFHRRTNCRMYSLFIDKYIGL